MTSCLCLLQKVYRYYYTDISRSLCGLLYTLDINLISSKMVGYFTDIFLYLVNNIFQNEIFSSLEKTHFDPDLPWKEKPMKVNSVIDVHVSICKKVLNHLSLKVLLTCSLQQTYTMNETNNVTKVITCFFINSVGSSQLGFS